MPCTILDPFNGAGTTGLVALQNKGKYIGIDLKEEYLQISKQRLLDFKNKTKNRSI
jgi:DNA modification methylase